jgi:hypothetical protein
MKIYIATIITEIDEYTPVERKQVFASLNKDIVVAYVNRFNNIIKNNYSRVAKATHIRNTPFWFEFIVQQKPEAILEELKYITYEQADQKKNHNILARQGHI